MRTVTNRTADAKGADTAEFRGLTLVSPPPGEHHATPLEPDPEMAGVFAIISDEFYTKSWNEAIAYVLRGDLRPRRPRPNPDRECGSRPAHLSLVPNGRSS